MVRIEYNKVYERLSLKINYLDGARGVLESYNALVGGRTSIMG